MTPSRGFTLIELLVALAIFGVLSAISLRAISSTAEQRKFVESESSKWRDLDRLFATLESDLGAAVSGYVPFEGHATPAADGTWLQLTLAGRFHADEAPTPPRAITYRLIDGHMARTTSVDPTHTAAATVRYPSAIAGLGARYLAASGEWVPRWQPNDDSLPRAVEIVVRLASREELRRVILLR